MDYAKRVTGKAFIGLACSLGESQKRYSNGRKKYVVLKEEFIGPMWMSPEEHRKMKESSNKK